MRYFFITPLLVLSVFFIQAQNVGIGTSTPGSKLTIAGSLGVQYTPPRTGNSILTSTDFYVVWNDVSNNGTITLPVRSTLPADNYKGRLYFIKNSSTKNILTIDASGNEKIDVTGGIGSEVLSINLASGESIMLINTGNTDPNGISWEVVNHNISASPNSTFWKLGGNSGSNVASNFLGTLDAQDLSIRTNGTEKMRITNGGNIGIGTSTPSHRLQVVDASTMSATLISAIQPDLIAGQGTHIKLGRSVSISPISFNNSADIMFGYAGDQSLQNYLGFSFHGNSERMVIRADGNVGIGTTSPGYRLHVNDANTAGDAVLFSSMQPNLSSGSTTYLKFGRSLANNETGNIGFRYESSSPSYIGFSFQNFPAEKMVIRSDGNVGIGTVAPGNKLTVEGSFGAAYIPKTTNHTMTANDFYVVWKDEGANGTITLPVASSTNNYKGRLYLIKNNSLTRTLTVRAATTESIDVVGQAPSSSVLLNSGEILNLISTGGPGGGITWEVVSHSLSSIPVNVPGATPWYINGNSGTTAGSNFLGTIDSRDLVMKTNNVEAIRITTLRNLNFPDQTNSSASLGIITKNGIPFIHNTRGSHSIPRINNTALGLRALNLRTSGDSNTAVGSRTLANLEYGFNNTAVGHGAMETAINGALSNSAFGSGALRYVALADVAGNTALGSVTLEYNEGGDNNTAVGHEALRYTSNGSSNVAIGAYAGTFSTANNCVYLGMQAGYRNTINERLIIDNRDFTGLDIFPLIEGNFSVTETYGGLTPRSVKINDDLTVARYLTVSLDQVVGGRFRANLGIRGNYLGGAGIVALSCDNAGNIIHTPSDARLKTNVHPIHHALDKVKNMQGYTYQFIDQQRFGSNMQMGFMAQELEKVVPEAVNNGEEYKSVNYQLLTALLTEAVKEQQVQIEAIKKENNELKAMASKIMQLEKDVSQLRSETEQK